MASHADTAPTRASLLNQRACLVQFQYAPSAIVLPTAYDDNRRSKFSFLLVVREGRLGLIMWELMSGSVPHLSPVPYRLSSLRHVLIFVNEAGGA